MYKDITSIILSGGKSSRMGRNKSFLKIGDKTIIERVRDFLQGIFQDVILITNDPEEYKFLGLPMFEDVYRHKGPLAGIHSGIKHSKTNLNFIISCDLPFMTKEMINYLIEYKTDKLITIAKADGFIQQLAGKYSKECLSPSEKILKELIENENRDEVQKKRKCNVLSLIDLVGAEIISAESLPFYNEDLYFNMNRTEDYNLLLNKLRLKEE
ncbi:MAG: molybdenum cofactor guanylyltransferase [Ignavibacteria bacterium]|nr:molybdenum cofactor guanylyltransferase [Ignavibacteria bacterium]